MKNPELQLAEAFVEETDRHLFLTGRAGTGKTTFLRSLARADWLALELQHVYRQSDHRFVELLDRVRDARLDDATLERLHSRHRPDFQPPEDEGWIVLSTHNRKVDRRNRSRLERLPGKAKKFRAELKGEFPESSYPAPKKDGASHLIGRSGRLSRGASIRRPRGSSGSAGGDGQHERLPGAEKT